MFVEIFDQVLAANPGMVVDDGACLDLIDGVNEQFYEKFRNVILDPAPADNNPPFSERYGRTLIQYFGRIGFEILAYVENGVDGVEEIFWQVTSSYIQQTQLAVDANRAFDYIWPMIKQEMTRLGQNI